MKRHTLKITATLLVASMGLTSLPVQAMSISTQEAIELTEAVDGRAPVNAMLARADVQAELARYGVDPTQAAERVAALSDAEIASLNQRVGDTAAGGSVVGAICGVAGDGYSGANQSLSFHALGALREITA